MSVRGADVRCGPSATWVDESAIGEASDWCRDSGAAVCVSACSGAGVASEGATCWYVAAISRVAGDAEAAVAATRVAVVVGALVVDGAAVSLAGAVTTAGTEAAAGSVAAFDFCIGEDGCSDVVVGWPRPKRALSVAGLTRPVRVWGASRAASGNASDTSAMAASVGCGAVAGWTARCGSALVESARAGGVSGCVLGPAPGDGEAVSLCDRKCAGAWVYCA